MKKKANSSPKNNKDVSILGLTDTENAQVVLDLAHEQQRAKEQDPSLTAVIVRGDKKESYLKWTKTDQLNDSLI